MASIPKKVPIPRRGVDYRGKVVLAPMVRCGELPSRLLALHYGADLVWGPETVDRSMIGTTRRVNTALNTIDFTRLPSQGHQEKNTNLTESLIFRLHPELEGKKLIFQIGTSDPDRAVQCARMVAADVVGIDVNAGCPKPFSTSGGMGAELLQTPDKLCAILEALVKEIVPEFEIGISVKIRLLETAEKTETLVRKLCATGITGLTVHCRTTPMRPRERAIREQLKMIADICRENGVACLMNGDVENRDQALILAKEFGTDGGMIATAAEANSSCFRSEADGGLAPWAEVVHKYMKFCLDTENRFGNTKYLLAHLIPGKAPVFRPIQQSKNYQQQCTILEHKTLLEQAIDIDDKIGLSDKQVEEQKLRQAQAKAEAKAKVNAAKKKRKNTNHDGGEQKKSRSLENPAQSSTLIEAEEAPLTELNSELAISA
ncbi:putative tRNA dihydrouridine synthase (Smm1) [Sclerotinia borealis F-4128]|uniref:Putative tRNA dihydrouridine synthase (Smm1) n=1 Tax=Sclerotinia borealis (strain F-4128) TaxID=1432307 RepID=W9CUK8_SCLBF|nr:putative tRNA dihydrouridine synthase (Smm1) [Sclerotinia borealis F-4128]